jgi:hypothetical protein|tara:strand:- start:5705 stop:5911 length:207 start_codon:yes stop_codon:yes gene_type:complete
MNMANEIKVRFTEAFYDGERYYIKGDTYTLPSDTAIPIHGIEILEGKSTHNTLRVTRKIKEENLFTKE